MLLTPFTAIRRNMYFEYLEEKDEIGHFGFWHPYECSIGVLKAKVTNLNFSQIFQINTCWKHVLAYMMQSSIGRSDWFDWTSKCHIFFSTENNPNNVYIERKLKLWRFQKWKNFFILVPFCIQNGIWRFIWIFAKSTHWHWLYWIFRVSAS